MIDTFKTLGDFLAHAIADSLTAGTLKITGAIQGIICAMLRRGHWEEMSGLSQVLATGPPNHYKSRTMYHAPVVHRQSSY